MGAGADGSDTAERVCVGAVSGVHGVRGTVRIKPFTETPEGVAAYGPVTDESGTRRFEIAVVGVRKGIVLATLSGIGDRATAEALKGLRLYVERSALPAPDADEFYYEDLVGLAAEAADGSDMGKVVAVYDFGAGDVIELKGPDGGATLLPFTHAVVPTVDIAGGRIVVVPPEELPDDAEAGQSVVKDPREGSA